MRRTFRLPPARPVRPIQRPAAENTAVPAQSTAARRGMVASPHQLASQAGLRVLQDGGSAVDAAIATNLVLSVAHPDMCGVGGDLVAVVRPAGGSDPVSLDAGGTGGRNHLLENFAPRYGATLPTYGPTSLLTPGAPAGWVALHDRFGRLPFQRLFDDAIHYADDGIPCPVRLVRSLDHWGPEVSVVHFGDRGERPAPGARLRMPGYARTLRAISADGADGFYRGVGGRELERVSEGLVTVADLTAYRPRWDRPLSSDVFGYEWWTVPAPSQAYIALLAADILENLSPTLDPDDPELWHLMIEATKAAARDRDLILGDPGRSESVMGEASRRAATVGQRSAAFDTPAAPGDTVFLCAVDSDGMAVSLSQSLFHPWGSRVELPSSGVIVQNRGSSFTLEAGHPNEMKPGRRPRTTLSPTVVTRDGELAALIGTMGGDVQPQVVLQLFVKILLCGMDPAEALAHPRYYLHRGLAPTIWSGQHPVVGVESRAERLSSALAGRGHEIQMGSAFVELAGHAQAIVAGKNGLVGGADPRSGTGGVAAW